MATQTTASGLQYEDTVIGEGKQATGPGQIAIVHYTGWLEDGTQFDSSKDRNDPFSFPMGCGRVIKGWDEGILYMKEGGRALMIVPSSLGYGSRAYYSIPANSVLIFSMHLRDIKYGPNHQ